VTTTHLGGERRHWVTPTPPGGKKSKKIKNTIFRGALVRKLHQKKDQKYENLRAVIPGGKIGHSRGGQKAHQNKNHAERKSMGHLRRWWCKRTVGGRRRKKSLKKKKHRERWKRSGSLQSGWGAF